MLGTKFRETTWSKKVSKEKTVINHKIEGKRTRIEEKRLP